MVTKEYKKEEAQQAIRQLKNNKSHGTDGITGEAYKALIGLIAPSITAIVRKIQQGDKIPPE